MQHAGVTHEGVCDGVNVSDVGQFGVEYAGEGEQGVALVLQGDLHRAEASCVLMLAGGKLGDDEVEQFSPGGQRRSGKGQNVVAQPLNKRSDVTGQQVRPSLVLPRKRQLGGKLVVWTTLSKPRPSNHWAKGASVPYRVMGRRLRLQPSTTLAL